MGEYVVEEVQKIYHVSKGKDTIGRIRKNGFELYAASDENYDGPLAKDGAPKGVFFTVTLVDGKLPTTTTYPRPPRGNSFEGCSFPRVAINLENLENAHENYKLYLVKNPTTPANQPKTLHFHVAMIHIRSNWIDWADRSLKCSLKRDNNFFYFKNGSWYAPIQKQPTEIDVWTNIFLIPAEEDNFSDQLRGADYDYVKHI